MPRTIVLPMTWEFAARICIECIKHGDNEKARRDAEAELVRMAKLLDKHLKEYTDDEC